MAPGGLTKLLGELAEQVLTPQIAARLAELMAQYLREGKMLEERDNVGKRFVERQHVPVARLDEARVQPVQQRVRGLVSDHVVRKAGEHHAAGKVTSRIGRRGGEIAEQQRLPFGAVVGIRLAQGMRINAETGHVLLALPVTILPAVG